MSGVADENGNQDQLPIDAYLHDFVEANLIWNRVHLALVLVGVQANDLIVCLFFRSANRSLIDLKSIIRAASICWLASAKTRVHFPLSVNIQHRVRVVGVLVNKVFAEVVVLLNLLIWVSLGVWVTEEVDIVIAIVPYVDLFVFAKQLWEVVSRTVTVADVPVVTEV